MSRCAKYPWWERQYGYTSLHQVWTACKFIKPQRKLEEKLVNDANSLTSFIRATKELISLTGSCMRATVCSTHPLIRTSGLSLALLCNVWHCVLDPTYEVLPLGVQVSLVGQAALHDIGAVVGAGLDGGQATTVGAVNQLHQGLHTLRAQRYLRRFDRTYINMNEFNIQQDFSGLAVKTEVIVGLVAALFFFFCAWIDALFHGWIPGYVCTTHFLWSHIVIVYVSITNLKG